MTQTLTLSSLPLFPLASVLFPDGVLALRVFEVRYLDMVRKCHQTGAPFGVVSLTQGSEVRRAGLRPVQALKKSATPAPIPPSAALGTQKKWRRRWRFWHPVRPAISPVKCWSLMAVIASSKTKLPASSRITQAFA